MVKINNILYTFIEYALKLMYIFWNKASFTKLKMGKGKELEKYGFSLLKFSEKDKNSLDIILEKIYQNSITAHNFYNGKSAHNLSIVGNLPLSLESLATKQEIEDLNNISHEILKNNPEILEYFGLEIPQLSLELTLLCNTTSPNLGPKVGSQNFHRDAYHSFYRGIKIFYAYNYREDLNDGAFSFIPLSSIGANVRPSKKEYRRKTMEERRFDLHPLIIKSASDAHLLKIKQLTAIDTYNCFHSGGYITSPSFIRLIFQVVVSPPQTPNRFSDIRNKHLGRMFYFNMIKLRNICRKPRA